jgi:hypothetical protein
MTCYNFDDDGDLIKLLLSASSKLSLFLLRYHIHLSDIVNMNHPDSSSITRNDLLRTSTSYRQTSTKSDHGILVASLRAEAS